MQSRDTMKIGQQNIKRFGYQLLYKYKCIIVSNSNVSTIQYTS